MWHYLKFFNFYIAVLLGLSAIWLGGVYIIYGYLLYLAFYILGDALLGDDVSQPPLLNQRLLRYMLYGALPISITIYLSALWLVLPLQSVIGQWITPFLPIFLVDARQNTTWWQVVIAIPFLGLMLGGVATVVAHELVHKVGNPKAVIIGRWLLAFSFDVNFSIEHVYNHHTKVGTPDDPATAPRGRNVYVHFVKAFIGTQKAGWKIEKKRLTRKQLSILSWHNAFLRGWLMSALLLSLAYTLAGAFGALMFIAVGLSAKFTLEVVNYMEHYGLVRHPRQPVQPRHSWNSNRRVSCWTMFNLPRHSHHHAQGAVPFEKLKAMPDSPEMISGYISTMAIALIPPLWFKLMDKKLAHWDAHYANKEELEIIQRLQVSRT
ncbi:alkane 1-monooxygenase [Alteromonas gracilis]|uniref:alkane 1-monooxygenase n=1 Tax=Alteromonas gracilis TaxID=1479524 RepID=UPI00373532B1